MPMTVRNNTGPCGVCHSYSTSLPNGLPALVTGDLKTRPIMGNAHYSTPKEGLQPKSAKLNILLNPAYRKVIITSLQMSRQGDGGRARRFIVSRLVTWLRQLLASFVPWDRYSRLSGSMDAAKVPWAGHTGGDGTGHARGLGADAVIHYVSVQAYYPAHGRSADYAELKSAF